MLHTFFTVAQRQQERQLYAAAHKCNCSVHQSRDIVRQGVPRGRVRYLPNRIEGLVNTRQPKMRRYYVVPPGRELDANIHRESCSRGGATAWAAGKAVFQNQAPQTGGEQSNAPGRRLDHRACPCMVSCKNMLQTAMILVYLTEGSKTIMFLDERDLCTGDVFPPMPRPRTLPVEKLSRECIMSRWSF